MTFVVDCKFRDVFSGLEMDVIMGGGVGEGRG